MQERWLHARLKARPTQPPLPSLLLANVRSLENKLDELRAQRETRECCALILTETWLSDSTPDSAIQLKMHSVHRGDRTAVSEKNKGGGVCIYINSRLRLAVTYLATGVISSLFSPNMCSSFSESLQSWNSGKTLLTFSESSFLVESYLEHSAPTPNNEVNNQRTAVEVVLFFTVTQSEGTLHPDFRDFMLL
ncbi:hypothetical protein AOLI_G00317130 [Acnodon oligacanthus]